MPNITQIIPPRVPFIDERTGLIAREWYRFLLNLYTLTGNSSASLEDLQLGPAVQTDLQAVAQQLQDAVLDGASENALLQYDQAIQALSLQVDGVNPDPTMLTAIQALSLDPLPAQHPTSLSWVLPSGIAVGASPFVYQNLLSAGASVIVSGGTVTAIDFSRDNATFYGVGQTAGMFTLSAFDRLRVTYTVAPTMTLIPR